MTTSYIIGIDSSIIESIGAEADATVRVEAQYGEVRIVGPFDDWAGYKVVAEFDDEECAAALAEKISANPQQEFDRLGYDHANWFKSA